MIQQTKNLKESLKECGVKKSRCRVRRHYFNRHEYEYGKAFSCFDSDYKTFLKVCAHPRIKITSAWAIKGRLSIYVEGGWDDVQVDYQIMTPAKYEKWRQEILNLTKGAA